MGSKISLRVAAKTPVAGVIALSPRYGVIVPGTPDLTKDMVTPIAAPKLLIASEDDTGEITRQVYGDLK